ncbi:MAG: pyridoxal-phosphate-dependent aminotransferase family protein [Acidimicrobiales bacterium]|jgi:alanine-glyoxylate transaminase/serine-glyoxylate transaminase/serine-pyruvate transaminase
MSGRDFTQNPGPTNIPERVLRAMARPPIDFGTDEFAELLEGCFAELNALFNNSGVLIGYTSSGHGSWEATTTNLFEEGDRVLLCDTGLFSAKWAELCLGHGVKVDRLVTGERSGVDPEALRNALAGDLNHEIRAVLVCHTETSTGITSDLGAMRGVLDELDHPALFVVDAIASFATTEIDMEAHRIDVALAASQKGLMMPIGLSVSAVSNAAIEHAQRCDRPRYYWDWRPRLEVEGYRKFCGTPPIHHLFGLREALDIFAEQGGLSAVVDRHRRLASAVQIAVRCWGQPGALELNALHEEQLANSVTCIRLADGIDANEIVRVAREQFNVTIGTGVGEMWGRSIRIGHMGDLNAAMVLGALGGVEAAMRSLGVPVGSGALEAAAIHLAATA